MYYKKWRHSGEAVDGIFYHKKKTFEYLQTLRKGQAKPPKSRPFPHFLSITLGMLSFLVVQMVDPIPS